MTSRDERIARTLANGQESVREECICCRLAPVHFGLQPALHDDLCCLLSPGAASWEFRSELTVASERRGADNINS